MKTLEQMEPRKPIESLPVTIAESGSYYLTKNLQFTATSGDAITVNASDVTIDLMGFTLSSTSAVTGGAITLNGVRCTVKNGNIVGTTTIDNSGTVTPGGFIRGVSAAGFGQARFLDLTAAKCRSAGLSGGTDSVAVRCFAIENGGTGITVAVASECIATNNAGTGMTGDLVTGCRADRNGLSGIFAVRILNSHTKSNRGSGIVFGTEVTHCTAEQNGGHGITAQTVIGCTAAGNGSHGIVVSRLAKDNQSHGNGASGSGAGIFFSLNGVRIEGNNCFENDWGIQSASGVSSFIVRNSCRANNAAPTNPGATGNFDFDRASNTYGPVVLWDGDISGSAAASNPTANIQF